MDNENKNFYETMIFLLIETLKNANSNITGDIRIFYKKQKEIVSVILGLEYEFKNLQLKSNYFSIKLCNEKGIYNTYKILYEDIVGFCSDVIYILYLNHDNKYNYIYPNSNVKLPHKLSNLFNEQIKINVKIAHKENHTVKITFFEQFPSIKIPKSLCTGDKLLVLMLEPGNWNFTLEEEGLKIAFLNYNGDVYLPYNSIVTYFNNNEGLFLNRNVKIVEEDFENDNNYIQDGNLIYVDFKEILKEELEDDLNMFNIFNHFTNHSNKAVENTDNLIIGNFKKDDKE